MGWDILVRPSTISGRLRAPGSKSMTHRALVIASLAEGVSTLDNALECSDTLSTRYALQDLGIPITPSGEGTKIQGQGGRFSAPSHPIDLGNSGTSLRFLTTVAGLAKGEVILTGDSSLRSRPMKELLSCLGELGVKAASLGRGTAPIRILGQGSIRGGETSITGSVSSQFISSLLIPAPYFERGLRLEIRGQPKSRPYIDLTLKAMRDFGVEVERDGRSFQVLPSRFKPRKYTIQGDYSSSSFPMLGAAITGGRVEVTGLAPESDQADEAFLNILRDAGCAVTRRAHSVIVEGGELHGIDVDLSNSPDLLPPVAVLASLAQGHSSIFGVEHARLKESDRISVIHQEFRRLGIGVEERADGLAFRGGGKPKGGWVDSHHDHRIAMALLILGTVTKGLTVRNADCVSVSYPSFLPDLEGLGAKFSRR